MASPCLGCNDWWRRQTHTSVHGNRTHTRTISRHTQCASEPTQAIAGALRGRTRKGSSKLLTVAPASARPAAAASSLELCCSCRLPRGIASTAAAKSTGHATGTELYPRRPGCQCERDFTQSTRNNAQLSTGAVFMAVQRVSSRARQREQTLRTRTTLGAAASTCSGCYTSSLVVMAAMS